MLPVNVHQTSRHTVLVIHAEGVDPVSVTTEISAARNTLHLQYRDCRQDVLRSVQLKAQPLILQLLDSEEPATATIQECSWSVSPANVVIKFTKFRPEEWQALQLDIKITHMDAAAVEGVDNAMDADRIQERTESLMVKFVTTANADRLRHTIRTTLLWDAEETGEQQRHVGNVQARKVAGENAIELRAELVSETRTIHP